MTEEIEVIDYVQEGNQWVWHWPVNRLDKITLSYDMVLNEVTRWR